MIVAALGVAACARQAVVAPRASAPRAVVVTLPSASAVLPAPVPEVKRPGLQEALCGGRADCIVKTAFKGAPGKDGDGRLVVLVPIKLSISAGDDAPMACQGNEVWLVRTARDGSVVDRQLVGSGCAEDTPYGVACDGLEIIRVQPPTSAAPTSVIVDWDGPGPGCGGWTRGSGDIEVSLESFVVRRRSEWSGRAAGAEDSHSRRWDFSAWSFTSEWQTSNGDCAARSRGPSFSIPKLALGSAFLDGAWRTANLSRCATTIDSSHGVALPSTVKSAAVLHAVVSETDALFVEVVAAPPAKPGAELRACFAAWNAHSYDYCHLPVSPECVRIALDGHVLSGNATVERAPDRARFRVQLPPETAALTVSYVEAGGRSVSSSAYRRNDATSLGNISSLGAEVASCHLDGQSLQRSTPPRDPKHELLDTKGLD